MSRFGDVAVYLAWDDAAPYALVRHARLVHAMARTTVILRFSTEARPWLQDEERVTVTSLAEGIFRVEARFGFMERTDVGRALSLAAAQDLHVDPESALYVLHSIDVETGSTRDMSMPRQLLYATMQRNAVEPSRYYGIPFQRVFTVGTVVRL